MSLEPFAWRCPECQWLHHWEWSAEDLHGAELAPMLMVCEHCNAKSKMRYVDRRWLPCLTELQEHSTRGPLHDEIAAECEAVSKMLQEKNAAYGNSAIEPIRVFSKASPVEQLLVRADDKLARIRNQTTDEDAVADLIGYLILLRIAQRGDA